MAWGKGRGGENAATTRKSARKKPGADDLSSLMIALEPRIVFDAAMIATAQDAFDDGEPEVSGDSPGTSPGIDALVAALTAQVIEAPREIAFIDAAVEDPAALIAALQDRAEVHVLSANRDGVAQIAEVLAGRSDVEAIHIVSHGRSGTLDLGSAKLTEASMAGRHAEEMTIIAGALSADADILIYGCDFASGARGESAVNALARLTGADVAASDDLTGAAALGGDWVLEERAGLVETSAIVVADWDSTLTKTVVNTSGGSAADGSDGLRIHVIRNGQLQVDYKGFTQLYEPTLNDDDAVIFNGVYMAVGNTVVGPGTNSNFGAPYTGAANGPGISSTDAIFQESTQSITGTGTGADPTIITTTLVYNVDGLGAYNPATDFQVVIETIYVEPNPYFTQRVTVTPPASNAQALKFYHTLDTFLSGGDNGPAFSLPQNLAATNNTTGDPSLVAVRKDPGGPNDSFVGFAETQGGRQFDHWYSALYNGANLYTAGLNNGG
ncbi:MAG TPA: DUF4347 domain-containing protein, partial [Rhizobiaceae bacterium]|nr:DUF4347 domain-containing protein [Rhizobiaceae bacterium]